MLQMKIDVESKNRNWDEPIYFGDGPPNDVENVACATTIGERIGRNACDGDNCTFVSTMALVSIYSYWEDGFRQKIAEALQMKKCDLKSDIFGEVGALRNAILHNRGRATRKVANARILAWFEEGDEIFLSQAMYFKLNAEVREYIKSISEIAL